MISWGLAVIIGIICFTLGIVFMAQLIAGGQADECMRCEFARRHKENDV